MLSKTGFVYWLWSIWNCPVSFTKTTVEVKDKTLPNPADVKTVCKFPLDTAWSNCWLICCKEAALYEDEGANVELLSTVFCYSSI